eukprot:CAMPEP_0118859430 /NCGR_PEP_ID=MMETSP1163-20130328/5684_1 /TAXON_ID=124430 /ORGANISM="Phaeomonas parva, Strain CCMP2877" /LENGTH=63 /DNA_ID=CAMNT_0006793021 /DNA_START=736 /DNA_END=927 /DNA_ORIENTATION=+
MTRFRHDAPSVGKASRGCDRLPFDDPPASSPARPPHPPSPPPPVVALGLRLSHGIDVYVTPTA